METPQYLWLFAKPATGKSVLASYVVGHIEEDLNQDASYFFFARGHKFKSWLSVCLRSLAYQMALKSSEVGTYSWAYRMKMLLLTRKTPRAYGESYLPEESCVFDFSDNTIGLSMPWMNVTNLLSS